MFLLITILDNKGMLNKSNKYNACYARFIQFDVENTFINTSENQNSSLI